MTTAQEKSTLQNMHRGSASPSSIRPYDETIDQPPPYTELADVAITASQPEPEGPIPTSTLCTPAARPIRPESEAPIPTSTLSASPPRSYVLIEPDSNPLITPSRRQVDLAPSSLTSTQPATSQSSRSITPELDVTMNYNPSPVRPQHVPIRDLPSNRLARPIVIPASRPALEAPFLRAHPTILGDYHLPKDIFLRLLDELNDIKLGAPPLQLLGSIAGVVGFVPSQIAQIVSGSVQAATTVTHVAMSKGRTELWLRDINKQVFEPRGLKMEIAKLSALAQITGMQDMLNEDGKLDKKARLLQPTSDAQDDWALSAAQRRLNTLEPWIAHLELVPLSETAIHDTNRLKKFNAAVSSRREKKHEKKTVENRAKAGEKHSKEMAKTHKDYEKEMSKLDKDEEKVRRKEAREPRKMEEELRKIEKERVKRTREFEKEVGKVDKDLVKDDKEEEHFRKLTFLVIRDLGTEVGARETSLPEAELAGRAV